MGAPILPTWTQDHYCFYQSDGSTQVGTADTQTTLDTDTIYYGAFTISDTTANKVNDLTGKPQFNLAGAGWVDVGTTTAIQFADGSLTDGGTTQNSSAIAGLGTFQGSRVYESTNITAIIWSTPGDETDNHGEAWFGFTIDSAQVSDGQEVLFRWVEGDGTVFTGTYNDADVDINEDVAPQIYDRTLSESIDILDQEDRYANSLRHLSDNIDIFDKLIIGQLIYRQLASEFDLKDAVTSEILSEIVRYLSESINISDTLNRLTLHYRTLLDDISVSDSASRYLLILRHIKDNADLTDSLQSVSDKVKFVILTEQITLTDQQRRGLLLSRIILSSFDLEDEVNRNILTLRTLTSNIDLQDTIISKIAGLILRVLSSSIDLTDSINTDLIRQINRVLTTAISINDILNRNTSLYRMLDTNIEINDDLQRWVSAAGTLIDRYLSSNIGLDDGLKRDLTIDRLLAVGLYLFDEISHETQLLRTIKTDLDITDEIDINILQFLLRILSDKVDLTDIQIAQYIGVMGDIGFIKFVLEQRKVIMELDKESVIMELDREPIDFKIEVPK